MDVAWRMIQAGDDEGSQHIAQSGTPLLPPIQAQTITDTSSNR